MWDSALSALSAGFTISSESLLGEMDSDTSLRSAEKHISTNLIRLIVILFYKFCKNCMFVDVHVAGGPVAIRERVAVPLQSTERGMSAVRKQ